MQRSVLFFLTPFLILLASSVSAQGLPSSLGGLELSASIENPSPGQTVTITAKSFAVDINGTTLTWTAGGKQLAKGVGVTSVTVEAPALGKYLNINVSAITSDGTSYANSISIGSASIDLVMETDGYKPPFFRGKIAPAYQNSVKIIAVPHLANSAGIEYDPKGLLYTWKQGETVLQSQSGYGKQSVTIPGAMVPRPYIATVTVTSRDGSVQGSGSISVEAGAPSVVFYRNDPLYGPLFNNAIGSTVYLGTQREVGVLAIPYGFNVPASGLGDLSFSWKVNGTELSKLAANKSVTLRSPGNAAGSSNVQLQVNNAQKILQQASGGFTTVFSASTATTSISF